MQQPPTSLSPFDTNGLGSLLGIQDKGPFWLLEAAADAMLITDQTGRIVLANRQSEALFGYTRAELLELSVENLMPSRFGTEHASNRQRFAAQPGGRSMGAGLELFGMRKDGTEVPVDVSLTPLEQGHVLATVYDITRRKRTEESLAEQSARLTTIVETAVDAIVTIDEYGTIDSVNPAAERLFGYGQGELLGENVSILMLAPHRQAHDGYIERYLVTGERRIIGGSHDLVALRKDGSTFPVLLAVGEMHIGDRRMFTALLHDITEDKARESELESHRRRLETLVNLRTAQLEKQSMLLREANSNLVEQIEERWAAEREVREYAAEIHDLYDNAPCGYWSLDTDGLIVRVNDTLLCWLGYSREEMIGRRLTEYLATRSIGAFEENFPLFKRGGEEWSIEFDVVRKDRSTLPVQVSTTAICDEDGNFLMSRSVVFDIAARKKAEEALRSSEARFRLLLDSVGEGIYGLDNEGRCTFINTAALAMLGYARDEVLGHPIQGLIHRTADGAPNPAALCPVYEAFHSERTVVGGMELLWRKDGSSFSAEYSARPMRENGWVVGVVSIFRYMTEPQSIIHRLSFEATHDALTGLVNRQEFERRLGRVLSESDEDSKENALLYLDLDQFKVVNDSCGHAAGDQLLRQLSAQLQKRLRGRDTLARLGGDEFGVLLERCPQDQALRIATDLRDAVQDYRFMWDGKLFAVGVSIGLVPLSAVGNDTASVLSTADAACYAAKEQGRNRIHLCQSNDALLEAQRANMDWVSRLTQALDANRFCLYQQAIRPLAVHDQGRPHYEMLLRLRDEGNQVILPMAFLPAAERYNLMPAIDRWVIREVISRHAVAQRDAPLHERPIYAINISGSSLADEHLERFVRGLLAEFNVPGDMICFEISENVAMANHGRVEQFIQPLKQEGCLFAVDNFGSNFASFSYLKELPVNYLKINGDLILSMEKDHLTCIIAAAINRIAHVMAIETVAECAESEPVLALLEQLDIDHVQGYALEQPHPLVEAVGTEISTEDVARLESQP